MLGTLAQSNPLSLLFTSRQLAVRTATAVSLFAALETRSSPRLEQPKQPRQAKSILAGIN